MSVVSLTTLLTVWLASNPADMGTLKIQSDVGKSSVQIRNTPPQHWLTSYKDATALASRHKLPLLLHFDAPWCGACRQMEKNVLNRSDVTALLGNKVIGVRLNADLNKSLIAEFGIVSLPTEVVILADGSRGATYTGATSLDPYIARLNQISGSNDAVIARSDSQLAQTEVAPNLRSCLIIKRDGKMVGLGGFSPVALKTKRQWTRGGDQHVAEHEGVCYYLSSSDEVKQFNARPDYFIPKYHGCDLVELSQENRALSGAIEYGAFYNNHVYFFASLKNRRRFEKNPQWFLAAATNTNVENEDGYPFFKSTPVNN